MDPSEPSLQLPALVYDGECGLCRRAIRCGLRHLPAQHVTPLPYQAAPLDQLGLTREQCAAALQWVDVEGAVHSGHRAVCEWLGAQPQRRWRLLARVLCSVGIEPLTACSYRLVARNRGPISRLLHD